MYIHIYPYVHTLYAGVFLEVAGEDPDEHPYTSAYKSSYPLNLGETKEWKRTQQLPQSERFMVLRLVCNVLFQGIAYIYIYICGPLKGSARPCPTRHEWVKTTSSNGGCIRLGDSTHPMVPEYCKGIIDLPFRMTLVVFWSIQYQLPLCVPGSFPFGSP